MLDITYDPGAAVANAIHDATGARVRDYPITLDKLIETLADPRVSRAK
jgi:CO/xanthine dehydrogenase Mo-binding subunit